MKNLHNPHPGEILLTEFMEPYELSNYRLAKDLNIPNPGSVKLLKEKGELQLTPPFGWKCILEWTLHFGWVCKMILICWKKRE